MKYNKDKFLVNVKILIKYVKLNKLFYYHFLTNQAILVIVILLKIAYNFNMKDKIIMDLLL